MRQGLRNIVQPVASQTDASQFRIGRMQTVSHLWQDVRLYAGPFDAFAYPRPFARLSRLFQGFFKALAPSGSHAIAHGRKTLRLRSLRQGVCRSFQSARSHADTLGHQIAPLRQVPQGIRPQILPQQTPRVVLLPRRCHRQSDAESLRILVRWQRHESFAPHRFLRFVIISQRTVITNQ